MYQLLLFEFHHVFAIWLRIEKERKTHASFPFLIRNFDFSLPRRKRKRHGTEGGQEAMKNNNTPFTDPSLLYQMQLRRKTTRHEHEKKQHCRKNTRRRAITHTHTHAKIEENASNNKHVQYTFLHAYYTRNSKMVNSRPRARAIKILSLKTLRSR